MTAALELRPYALPFRAPIRTAAGVFPERRGVLVLARAGGVVGLGDVAPWPGFGDGRDAVAAIGEAIEGLGGMAAPESPGDVARAVGALGLPPEAAHGLEQALLDLLTRQRGVPLHRALGACWQLPARGPTGRVCAESAAGNPADVLNVPPGVARGRDGQRRPVGCVTATANRLLGPSAARSVAVHALVADAAEAAAAVAAGFRALKIKVGDEGEADARVGAIRAAVGDVALRLDANGAWGVEQAVEAVRRLARHAPAWIEQPVRGIGALAAVRAAVPGVRIAVDEDLGGEADLEQVIAQGAADVAVVKPMFAGGLLAARQLALRAAAAGLQAVVTCALESAVGRCGALHLAATLPGGEAHGLLAPLARDVASLPRAEGGRLAVPSGALSLEAPC